MMKKLLSLFLFTFVLATVTWAQSMTDEQVVNYVKTATKAGKSQQQIMKELATKGVTRAQAERIKKLYDSQQNAEKGDKFSSPNRLRRDISNEETQDRRYSEGDADSLSYNLQKGFSYTDQLSESGKKVFGRNIFNTQDLTFAPSQNIATPANYKLGPGDEVIIDIWGDNQDNIQQTISPDGYISVPNIGLLYLNGMTITSAENYLKRELNKIYSGIISENPTSFIKVTLGQIRTIQINVMGEVAFPGTYALSSLSTIFHALYKAGGINELGSLRHINLMRSGKKIATVDVYDFILNGKTMEDIKLQEGDVIIVPPYDLLVNIDGKVKRPMFYEMRNGETVKKLLEYAGNFTGDAYTKNIQMTRKNGREYQIYTIDDLDYSVFKLMDGDSLSVSAMLDRFENRLEVKGAVYRPGVYQFSGQLNTVKQLIAKADGLKGDAFTTRAVLHREREDLTKEVIQVDIKNILNGTKPDIPLQRNDILYIPSIHDLRDIGNIEIFGEVAVPGTYTYADNMTLEDIIIQAGGLLEAASTVKVDVARRIKNNKSTESDGTLGEMFTFALKEGFVIDGEPGFTLQPYDQVYVRRSPGYQEQINVQIEGEVLYEGTYALTSKSERLSDVVKKAGGVSNFAYVKGAKLMRRANKDELKRLNDIIEMMEREMGNTVAKDSLKLEVDSVFSVGINLEEALKKPGSDVDIVLREGDRLIIPELTNTVRINGAVLIPNTVAYQENKSVKDYISQAGGFANGARKSKAFIIYMNGQVAKVKGSGRGMVEPGCEIVVPVKDKTKAEKWNVQTILGIASSLSSLGLTAASVANMLK